MCSCTGKGIAVLNDITLGQYYPGNSIVHRMDPRTKLLLTIVYIVGVFFIGNIPGYLIALAFLALTVRVAGIRFSYLLKGVKPLRFIIIFTFVLNLLFSSGETPLLTLGFFRLTKEGRDPGQGIGHLQDGTMVIVENGKEWIGGETEVTVTAVRQTGGGRMVFAKKSGQ